MFSWYPSWISSFKLPSLNFSLPSAIQRRFISFVLKKSLGHFLRPGQFDIHQIDSQIGSGYVQVNDLELDNEAINSLISGLPVRLYDGSISAVTVRIPWPNPLTSNLGFSLNSLHLTFHLLPKAESSFGPNMNLANSVLSVAESFIHQELTPREEAALRESFHSEFTSYLHSEDDEPGVPGALDPFLTEVEAEEFHAEADPAGLSLFATLLERLLARFECDATNIKITIVYPEKVSFTLTIDKIRYGVETTQVPSDDTTSDRVDLGETRTLTVIGVTLTSRNMKPLTVSPPPTIATSAISPISPASPSMLRARRSRSVSPASSSSSLDEETNLLMSQSLAFLPPRPSSPTDSVTSSLYQSAISSGPDAQGSPSSHFVISTNESTMNQASEISQPEGQSEDVKDDIILSFGTEPIVFKLTTPPIPRLAHPPPPRHAPGRHSAPDKSPPIQATNDKETLRISVSMGIISCALRAAQIRDAIETLNCWSSHSPHSTNRTLTPEMSPGTSPVSTFADNLEATLCIKGLVILFLSPELHFGSSIDEASLKRFFDLPVVPPILSHGYVRLYFECMHGSMSISPQSQGAPSSRTTRIPKTPMMFGSFSVEELSTFAFYPTMPSGTDAVSPDMQGEMHSVPLLITDPSLASQYPATSLPPDLTSKETLSQLPTFDVVDFMDEKHRQHGPKLSPWRTKLKRKRPEPNISPSKAGSSPPKPDNGLPGQALPALHLTFYHGSKSKSHVTQSIQVKVVPLHVFVDLGLLLGDNGPLAFIDEATLHLKNANTIRSSGSGEDSDSTESEMISGTPPAIPHARQKLAIERERRRLEKLVIDDLDLDIDYRLDSVPEQTSSQHQDKKSKFRRKCSPKESRQHTSNTVDLAMVRIHARCPSPSHLSQRSGAIVLDLHKIHATNGVSLTKSSLRFKDTNSVSPAPVDTSAQGVLLVVECREIILSASLARSTKATGILSVGPLASSTNEEEKYNTDNPPPLLPRISVMQPTAVSSASEAVVLSADIPLVQAVVRKDILDALQYWADDISQLIGGLAGDIHSDSDTEKAGSADTSLIGSRYFTKSRSASGSVWTINRTETRTETVIKVAVSETYLSLQVPRQQGEDTAVRPINLHASDVDILLEFKPDGKDETVLTLGIMDLMVTETSLSGGILEFLSLTSGRSMDSSSKPLLKLRFISAIIPETTAKETRISLTLCGCTYNAFPDFTWVSDLSQFIKAPPGAFESVIPSERMLVSLKIMDGSLRVLAPSHPGALVIYIGDTSFVTSIVGDSPEMSFKLAVTKLAVLALDDLSSCTSAPNSSTARGVSFWKSIGYALLAEIDDLDLTFCRTNAVSVPDTQLVIDRIGLRLHLCADTLAAVSAFSSDLGSAFKSPDERPKPARVPSVVSEQLLEHSMSSLDEYTFRQMPDIGPAPDFISDDLPTNMDYLDESFGAAAGLRELRDDDLDDFSAEDIPTGRATPTQGSPNTGVVSNIGGETIKVLHPNGINIVEHFFDTLPPITEGDDSHGDTTFRMQLHHGDITLFLYEGYDWARTRKTIEDEVKWMRKRLAKIRQLVASGQTQDTSVEETSALLFNSVYIGLDHDVDELEPGALIAAIDDELREDIETASQSSWQSLKPSIRPRPQPRSIRVHGKRITRARGPSIEIRLLGADVEVDRYRPEESTVSRTFATVTDVEILDHIKTSTWKKFLTGLRSDFRGNIRETGSNMVRVELLGVRPVPGHPSEEARLRVKLLPLRLYVDQDALDFLKKFFSFKDPNASPTVSTTSDTEDIYFQHAEVFPVDLKLDYKPRRVDYRALKEGRTIELMNFFHFDGAEMTLRHITLSGITGWPRFFDMLNDLWTPDVKATQLVDVISGVSPIRSMVNVGSGVADLVLLPIAQYKKDGRIVRGFQKGTTSFFRSTAMEAIKMGARLATGTQVILEQTEGILGGQFSQPITAEALHSPSFDDESPGGPSSADEERELISKYADQPMDIKEGVQSAYRSLKKNFSSAAQTILAVPMEVYERSGSEGPIRAVIRAVPIAVLKPMIGATEAVGQTLMGLHNTLDPTIRQENEAKYKHY